MLFKYNLPKILWEEAVNYACYLKNRSPTRALNGMTPYEAFHGKKPDLSNLHEFGCDVWILKPENQQNKLEPKSEKFVFTGFSNGGNAYRYYNPRTHKVLVSREAHFPEAKAPEQELVDVLMPRLEGECGSHAHEDKASPQPEMDDSQLPSPTTNISPPTAPDAVSDTASDYQDDSTPSRRTSRPVAKIDYRVAAGYKPYKPKGDTAQAHFVETCFHAVLGDPKNLAEAKERHDWPEWDKAMRAEIAQHQRLKTYELVDLPKGRKAIRCRWHLHIKTNSQGEIVKYKARLIAQGFTQTEGEDYFETYAPVSRQESLRALTAFAALHRFHIHQLDVVAAYLHSTLEEEIYMKQPPEFDDGTGRVCRVIKAIYGLKQPGRTWNAKLNADFAAMQLRQLTADSCVYTRTLDNAPIFIVNHVDDMSVMASTLTTITRIKTMIASRLEVSHLGEIQQYIGIEFDIDRERGIYSIHQTAYVTKIIDRFGMLDSKPVRTPLDYDAHLTATPTDVEPDHSFPYAMAIGSLMYAAVGTRPDISFAIQYLAQFTSRPSAAHITAVKRIFRYLNGTRNLRLTYRSGGSNTLEGFTDADWATSAVDRRSVAGYIFTLAGGAISWSSAKQRSVATSSMESEYMALAHATKEAIWLRFLFHDLGLLSDGPTPLHADNQAAISYAHNDQFHKRSKHIDVRYHFTREHLISNEISVPYCASEDNFADLFMKALARPSHETQVARIGLRAP